ncbi:MAG: 6-phosphogluconolactonase [Hominenteromicrobium sp.]
MMRCNCPNVVCTYHGNCAACIAHNRETNKLAHCMEKAAEARGAKMPLRIPETYLEDDFEAMSRRSAELICETVRRKPDAMLSLAAGNTAIRTYEILKEMADAGAVDFSRVHFVALDDWLDLEDESENCDAFMRRYFYGPLGIPDTQVTRFDIHADDLDAACKAVDAVIFAHGGLDLMLLGIGMNGHLGLNEPNSDFSLYAKVVDLDPVTTQVGQKYFSDGMKLTRGITLGIRHLFDCGHVILQAGGAHKADIMERVYRTAPTEEIPATVLKIVPHGTVVLDRDAAAKIMDLLS